MKTLLSFYTGYIHLYIDDIEGEKCYYLDVNSETVAKSPNLEPLLKRYQEEVQKVIYNVFRIK